LPRFTSAMMDSFSRQVAVIDNGIFGTVTSRGVNLKRFIGAVAQTLRLAPDISAICDH
jgi:hypothetical protein